MTASLLPPVIEIQWQTISDALATDPATLVSSMRQKMETGAPLHVLDVLPGKHRCFFTWDELRGWFDPLMVLADRTILDATQLVGLTTVQQAQALSAWRVRLETAAAHFREVALQLPPPVLHTLTAKHALLEGASHDLVSVIGAIERGDQGARQRLLELFRQLRDSLLLG